jgi:hypothetical protein
LALRCFGPHLRQREQIFQRVARSVQVDRRRRKALRIERLRCRLERAGFPLSLRLGGHARNASQRGEVAGARKHVHRRTGGIVEYFR